MIQRFCHRCTYKCCRRFGLAFVRRLCFCSTLAVCSLVCWAEAVLLSRKLLQLLWWDTLKDFIFDKRETFTNNCCGRKITLRSWNLIFKIRSFRCFSPFSIVVRVPWTLVSLQMAIWGLNKQSVWQEWITDAWSVTSVIVVADVSVSGQTRFAKCRTVQWT